MFNLITKQFLRSRAVMMTLALTALIGIVSIFTGKQFLSKQEATIAHVTEHQREHIDRNVKYHEGNIGLLLYYVRFALINKPEALAGLSIGQRDVNPGIQSVTIRALEGQKYDTDLNNPANLLSGNLDLGFVIIYLFPLVIIAFTFNLLSEENEGGTWRMLTVQSKSKLRFLLKKLSPRIIVVYGVLMSLFFLSAVILPLRMNESFLAFMCASILYLAFWFAVGLLVVSLNRGSSFNALILLSTWVTFAILLPAAVNNYVSIRYPVPESLSTMIKQRDGYHRKWDVDRKMTMDKFFEHYPQYREIPLPEGEFSYAWYYAMQQMGDDESRNESKAMRDKIIQRERASRSLSMIIPTMHTQLLFNDLAGTSLQDHLNFVDRITDFHERMRLYFYPKIFRNAPVKNEDWSRFKPEYVRKQFDIPWRVAVVPVLMLTVLTMFIAVVIINCVRPV